MFKITRNPNYLGEMMLYFAFANIGGAWTGYIILFVIWTVFFTKNMLMKEESYKKKQGWEEYSKQSYMLLPRFFKGTDIPNYIVYGIIIAIGVKLYLVGNFLQFYLKK